MKFDITKGLRIPPADNSKWGKKYPFDQLEIGDSFWIPRKAASEMSGSIRYWKKRLGHSYTTRKEVRADVPGVRIWRKE